MKIGIMNNPSKSVYDEAAFCGKAGFDFLDLTIEGPHATTVDISKLRPLLDSYGLSITGHIPTLVCHMHIQSKQSGMLVFWNWSDVPKCFPPWGQG
jgi:sugar phosphate isomerase/epimerase